MGRGAVGWEEGGGHPCLGCFRALFGQPARAALPNVSGPHLLAAAAPPEFKRSACLLRGSQLRGKQRAAAGWQAAAGRAGRGWNRCCSAACCCAAAMGCLHDSVGWSWLARLQRVHECQGGRQRCPICQSVRSSSRSRGPGQFERASIPLDERLPSCMETAPFSLVGAARLLVTICHAGSQAVH